MNFLLTLCLLLLSLSSYSNDSCHHDSHSFRCVKYVRNYDADTVTFNIPNAHPLLGKNISVRVMGVDTPEMKTKNSCEKEKARIAKKIVSSLMSKAKRIDLTNVKRDKYFRILADIEIDGVSLSHYLLKNNLAYPYYGGTKRTLNWCNHRNLAFDDTAK
jgi:micrococcal nuclease